MSLNFIVQRRATIETELIVNALDSQHRVSFAILCNATQREISGQAPNPLYSRPEAHSIDELLSIFTKLRGLALDVHRVLNA